MVHNIWSNAQLRQGARRIGQHKTNAKMFRNAYFVYLLGPAFLDINLALFMKIRIVRFNLELKKKQKQTTKIVFYPFLVVRKLATVENSFGVTS